MKKILLIMAVLWCAVSAAQGPPQSKYTLINTTGYNWLRGYFQALHLPAGCGAPSGLAAGQWSGSGAVYLDSCNNAWYYWQNLGWHQWNATIPTLQEVLTAGNLITDPAATIQNDPTNLTGAFTTRMGVGGTYQGLSDVGYSSTRLLASDAAGNNIGGFYSSVPPVSVFGLLSKNNSAGMYTYLNGSKWQYVWIDSNRAKIEADTVDLLAPTYAERMYIGTPGTVPSGGGNMLTFARAGGTKNDGRPTGVLFASTNVPTNRVGVSLGSLSNHWLGFYVNNKDYIASIDSAGLVIGMDYAGNVAGHDFPPQNGLIVQGGIFADSVVRLSIGNLGVSGSSSDSALVKDASGYMRAAVPLSSLGSGGAWTPTYTGVTNVTGVSGTKATYTRGGNIVTVTITVAVTPTAAGDATTSVRMSLPVASDFTTTTDAHGLGGVSSATPYTVRPFAATADATNNEVLLTFNADQTGSCLAVITFQYEIK